MDKYSYINYTHPEYVDQMYKTYLDNPESVDDSWRMFFTGYQYGQNGEDTETILDDKITTKRALKELAVINLINAYRTRGHLFTHTNPVRERRLHTPNLDLKNFHLKKGDLDTVYEVGGRFLIIGQTNGAFIPDGLVLRNTDHFYQLENSQEG